jgi:hypothetical protein
MKTVHVPRTSSIKSKLKSPKLSPIQRRKIDNIGVQEYRYNQQTHKIDSKIPRRISLKTIKQTQSGKSARNYIADLFLPTQMTIHVQLKIFHHIGKRN